MASWLIVDGQLATQAQQLMTLILNYSKKNLQNFCSLKIVELWKFTYMSDDELDQNFRLRSVPERSLQFVANGN